MTTKKTVKAVSPDDAILSWRFSYGGEEYGTSLQLTDIDDQPVHKVHEAIKEAFYLLSRQGCDLVQKIVTGKTAFDLTLEKLERELDAN